MTLTPHILSMPGQNTEPTCQQLDGHLGIASAMRLRSTLIALASLGTDVRLDCRSVDYLDTSALQLLIGMEGECRNRQHDMQLINVSNELQCHLARVGLDTRFTTPTECHE